MNACSRLALLAAVALVPISAPATSRGEPKEALAKQVRAAIDRGVQYLKSRQRNGNWEHCWDMPPLPWSKDGLTCLAMLALLESGVSPQDAAITSGLAYLRNVPPEHTYVVGLQTMVFAHPAFDRKRDKFLISRNVDWLRKTMKRGGGGQADGWGYGNDRGPGRRDNSNTQYALLGLHAAATAGVKIDEKSWKDIQDYYVRSQCPDGGWSYNDNRSMSTVTMSSAGVCGLLITGMQLYKGCEVNEQGKAIRKCGEFEANKPLQDGLKRLGDIFTVRAGTFSFYNLYGIERAGRLSGQRFFTGGRTGKSHDWYRAGAEYLVGMQNNDGSWRSSSEQLDGNRIVATSFSLLFLAKGKTPVLMHKMMHGRGERQLAGDWNNDANDVRNLTEYASKNLFKRLPLTWQAFDASKLEAGDPDSVKEMLQAPIMYFNGHRAPQFTDGEKHLIKHYVEQGGFVLAEACCSREEFDRGFRELVREIWPDRKLDPLPADHPIWTAFAPVPPGSFKLEGIDFGCKTCLVYAPQDMSCYWESNKFGGPEESRAVLAFRTGGNIIAYATGLEPPEDKLTPKEVVSDKVDTIKRNFLYAGQINYGGRDWQPAPKAMRTVMDHLRKEWNIDVILQTKELRLGDPNLSNYKFLYMHGRRKFTVRPEDQKLLRQHVEIGGGILLADACCGSKPFDEAFRALVGETFGRDLQPIKLDDPFYTERIGRRIETVKCRTEGGREYRSMSPQLEGIRLDPKNEKSPWIVIYSKYDLGCALEKHHSPDCLGHSHESALELAAQAALYALKE